MCKGVDTPVFTTVCQNWFRRLQYNDLVWHMTSSLQRFCLQRYKTLVQNTRIRPLFSCMCSSSRYGPQVCLIQNCDSRKQAVPRIVRISQKFVTVKHCEGVCPP